MARKPGIVPLRPLGFGDILDGGFQAIRTNPRTMIGFAAIVLTVSTVLTVVPQAALQKVLGESAAKALEQADPAVVISTSLTQVLAVMPGALITRLAVIVLNAMLVVAVSAAVLGEKTSPGQLWRRVRRRVPAAIGLALLTGLTVAVIGLVVGALPGVPAALAFANDNTVAGLLLLLLALLLGGLAMLAAGILFALAAPALLLEELGVVAAMRRSWRLVRSSFWRTLGLLLVAEILISIVSGLISAPFAVAAALIDSATDNTLHTDFLANLASSSVSSIGTIVVGSILNPWMAAVTALIYIDLRMRREGLDLELIRAADARAAGAAS
jgi:hypothetical protein